MELGLCCWSENDIGYGKWLVFFLFLFLIVCCCIFFLKDIVNFFNFFILLRVSFFILFLISDMGILGGGEEFIILFG